MINAVFLLLGLGGLYAQEVVPATVAEVSETNALVVQDSQLLYDTSTNLEIDNYCITAQSKAQGFITLRDRLLYCYLGIIE